MKVVMSDPVISVIIPTRERVQTLSHTLRTALAQASDRYEIIVSDNASEDNTRAAVAAIGDVRIRYINTGARLSMCDNYDFALSHARGRYVVIIGDDDAVLPGRLDALIERIEATTEPVIFMWPLHIYDWPTATEPAALDYYASPQAETTLDLREKARTVVRLGGWKYYELPSPYHSAVPRVFLDAIRDRTGRVFHSTQPDVFTAMALPAFTSTAINLGSGVTMNGRSPKSNGKDFTKGGSGGNLVRFLSEYGDYDLARTLYPGVSMRANMIPDAILKAKELFPSLYADVPFGYSAMWGYVARLRFVGHFQILRDAAAIRRYHPLSIGRFLRAAITHEAAVIRRHVLNAIGRRPIQRDGVPDNIFDIARALSDAAKRRPKFEA